MQSFLFILLAQGSLLTESSQPRYNLSRSLRLGAWAENSVSIRSDWKTFGNGPNHTGYFPDVVLTDDLTASWIANVPGWASGSSNTIQQLAVADGRVYATPLQYFGDAWLKAFDSNSGAPLWSYTFASCYSINPPTFQSGSVFVQRNSGGDSQIWRFDAASGEAVWSSFQSSQWARHLAPVVHDGKVWSSSGYYGGMYCHQQATGAQVFWQAVPNFESWTPSVHAGRLYSWLEGVLREHDSQTGVEQWSVAVGWTGGGGIPIGRTCAVQNARGFAVGAPHLYAIDLTSRAVAWTVAGNFHATPAIANGVVYVPTTNSVRAYDAWDGHFLGLYAGNSGTVLNQPIVTDDAVIFCSSTQTYLYRRSTFELVQTIQKSGELSFADHRLYIAATDGRIYTYTSSLSPAPAANLVAEWEPWTPAVGDVPRTTRISITNYGAMTAAPCQVSLWLSADTDLDASDVLLRRATLSTLAVGEMLEGAVVLDGNPLFAGKYLLLAPDDESGVSETNEDNVVPSGRIP